MPLIQVRLSPLANSHVVRWKELRGFRLKGDAVSDLLERADVDELLKGVVKRG